MSLIYSLCEDFVNVLDCSKKYGSILELLYSIIILFGPDELEINADDFAVPHYYNFQQWST